MVELAPDQSGVMHVTDMIKVPISVGKDFTKKMGTIDGLMSVYEKIAEKPSSDKSDVRIKDFFDKYIFNADESREVLHEFLSNQKNSKLNMTYVATQKHGR